MKNKLTIIARSSLAVLALGSLCMASSALAQNPPMSPMPKKDATPATATEKTDEGKKDEGATGRTDKAKPSATLSAKDRAFMKEAAKGGMMEVEWGKLAAEKGESADVKKFGNRMVTDHSKANNELMSLAAKKGVKLPSHKAGGKWKSDKDYMDVMVKDHEKNLAEFQAEAKEGSDPDLKKWADKTSKVIQKHLTHAKEIQSKLK